MKRCEHNLKWICNDTDHYGFVIRQVWWCRKCGALKLRRDTKQRKYKNSYLRPTNS